MVRLTFTVGKDSIISLLGRARGLINASYVLSLDIGDVLVLVALLLNA